MANKNKCSICGKGSIIRGRRILLRGNYNPTTRKRKYPNLQKVRLPQGNRVLACAKCIKAISRRAIG